MLEDIRRLCRNENNLSASELDHVQWVYSDVVSKKCIENLSIETCWIVTSWKVE